MLNIPVLTASESSHKFLDNGDILLGFTSSDQHDFAILMSKDGRLHSKFIENVKVKKDNA